MKQILSILVLIISISFIYITSSIARTNKSEENLWVAFLFKHLPLDKTVTCVIRLEPGCTPASVVITPNGGITFTDWEIISQTTRSISWSVKISIDKNAVLGKREIRIMTDKGKTSAEEVEVVTHIPEISEFKIISASSNPAKINFSFKAYDAFADFDSLKKQVIVVALQSEGQFMGLSCIPSKVTRLNDKTFIVEIEIVPQNQVFYRGSSCNLSFNIEDKNGYQSIEFNQKIDF